MANSNKLMKEKRKVKDSSSKTPCIIPKRNLRSNPCFNPPKEENTPAPEAGKPEEKTLNKRKKYIIDCSDIEMNISDFQNYLRSHIKIDGKLNNSGKNIRIKEKEEGIVTIKSDTYLAKKYIRFLTNKYLRGNVERKVRIVGNTKKSYKLIFK